MNIIFPKLERQVCQNQRLSCKRSQVQALCVDQQCKLNRNLCLNCIQDHENHSMVDYSQLIDLLEHEEKSNNKYKILSLKVEKQFNLHKSIILKELQDQEERLKNLLIQIRSQYTPFDILQKLISKNKKLTLKETHEIGAQLSAFLVEKKKGEHEFYEIRQVEFEKTDQYLPIQAILSRLAFSLHYLTQSEKAIEEPLEIKPIDCYQHFTQLQNSLQFTSIYNQVSLSSQQQLRSLFIEKAENINKSIQQLQKTNFYWQLNEKEQLQCQNVLDLIKSIYKQPLEVNGHTNQIRAMAISQNEEFIASGDWDGLIVLWKLQLKKQIRQFNCKFRIQDLSFSNDNKYLAATQRSNPNEIQIYDLSNTKSNEPKFRLQGHTSTIWRIQLSLNFQYLISGSEDKTIKIWKISSQTIVTERHLSDEVNGLSVSPNQQFISACCENGQAFLFDSSSFEEFKQLTQWKAHETNAFGTTFTPDNKIVLTSGIQIKLWSINQLISNDENKIPIKIFQGNDYIWSIRLLFDRQILIGNDGQIKIWNLKTDQLIYQLDVPGGYQYANDRNFAITQDLKQIITGGKNCKLKYYELKDI